MVLSLFRIGVGAVVMLRIALGAVPAYASAPELATAQGTITISEAHPGLRAPSCSELLVEARDALDNHLIAETRPMIDQAGTCRYMLTVPAQTAVWLRLRPVLVDGARVVGAMNAPANGHGQRQAGGIALRFTIIAPTTYFFTPNEQKAIPMSY